MGAIDQEPTPIDEEETDTPGVTFSVHPYEIGCGEDSRLKVSGDVLAAPGDGRGERVVARCDNGRYEFVRNHRGELEKIDPPGGEVPAWAKAAIVEIGVGRVRD